MRISRHCVKPVLVIAGLSLALVGCANDSKPQSSTLSPTGSTPKSSTSAASSPATLSASGYLDCLRKAGLKLPDGVLSPDDRLDAGKLAEASGVLTRAQAICGTPPASLLAGLKFDSPAIKAAISEFGDCLRGQGVPFKDPDLSKSSTELLNELTKQLDSTNEKIYGALQKCQPALSKALAPTP